jgi:uncharacterized repeat protein (TIGR04138 family)
MQSKDVFVMSFREQLARVIARDPRYSIEAYAFVLESLRLARRHKLKILAKRRDRGGTSRPRKKDIGSKGGERVHDESCHVTGQELCMAARRLAVRTYGLMAITVLAQWGICCTSDIGEIVFSLIATGDLAKTPSDSRADFDDVFDFSTSLRPRSFVDDGNPS